MQVGDFATLKVVKIEHDGAWLDWEQTTDLFLPREEQKGRLSAGDEVVVFITDDERDRPVASMRLDDFVFYDTSQLAPNQKVELLIIAQTDLGFKAVVDNRHFGVLYRSEVFQPLRYGQKLTGYIKKVREDRKLDLMLQPMGTKGRGELGTRILDEVKSRGGFLAVTDKSAPEVIYELFGVSKKKFKMALGGLYRQQLVSLESDGIRLNKS